MLEMPALLGVLRQLLAAALLVAAPGGSAWEDAEAREALEAVSLFDAELDDQADDDPSPPALAPGRAAIAARGASSSRIGPDRGARTRSALCRPRIRAPPLK